MNLPKCIKQFYMVIEYIHFLIDRSIERQIQIIVDLVEAVCVK